MPTAKGIRLLFLSGMVALLTLSVATCRLDMLLKPSAPHKPVLAVTPTLVRDSARAGSDEVRRASVEIKDGDGNASFEWTASEDLRWIRLSPRDGTTPDTLTVMLDPNDLAPGTYTGKVTVTSTATETPVDIDVTFVIQRPGLVVTPMDIVHGTNVNSGASFDDTLRISNNGTGPLVWTATKSKSWITLGNTAGTGPGVVPLTIRSAGLPAGVYRDEIVITAPGATGSPARVDVTLTIFAPRLAVSPPAARDSAIVGSTELRTQNLHVTNSGTGTVTWTATKSQPWVTLSKSAGGAPDDVAVSLNPAGLPPGTYHDTIVLTSPEATNSPINVPVEFAVQQPGLTVTPAAITDGAKPGETTPRTHTLTVSNSGGGFLSWMVTQDQLWISTSPPGGTAPGTITVTLDPRGLGSGRHTGNVIVTAPGAAGSPATIPVTFTIDQPCTEIPVLLDVVQRDGTLNEQDCRAPHRAGSWANLYSFAANAGDTLSIRFSAETQPASFDAYLILTDGAGTVLAENDECFPETGTACITDFRVPATGRYLIEATTAGPGQTGLVWIWITRERPPSPPQAIGQFRKDGVTGIGIGATTPEDAVVLKGTISDPNEADSVRLEIELEPLGSPFTDARTHQSAFVPVSSGSVAVAVTAGELLDNTGYHWQARTCDRTGRCSPWIKFGGNAETAADFTVSLGPPGTSQGAKP